VGHLIADCQLPISDWRLPVKPIGNRQSQIENPETHPLPRGGTDFMSHGNPDCIGTEKTYTK
jgi:hypothetical protein